MSAPAANARWFPGDDDCADAGIGVQFGRRRRQLRHQFEIQSVQRPGRLRMISETRSRRSTANGLVTCVIGHLLSLLALLAVAAWPPQVALGRLRYRRWRAGVKSAWRRPRPVVQVGRHGGSRPTRLANAPFAAATAVRARS